MPRVLLNILGPDRAGAIETVTRALEEFEVGGVKSTIPLHLRILADPEFRSGTYDTRLVSRLLLGKAVANG